MYVWVSSGRLRPMRMMWLARNFNEPKYSIVRWERPGIRAYPALPWARKNRVSEDRDMRQRYPGNTGKWPHNRNARRK